MRSSGSRPARAWPGKARVRAPAARADGAVGAQVKRAPGRRVNELGGGAAQRRPPESAAPARCSCAPVPGGLPAGAATMRTLCSRCRRPEQARSGEFALEVPVGLEVGAGRVRRTGMEMRWLDEPFAPGPLQGLDAPAPRSLPGRPLSALARSPRSRTSATASRDAAVRPVPVHQRGPLLHLQREPRGEWVGLDSRTILHPGGGALAEASPRRARARRARLPVARGRTPLAPLRLSACAPSQSSGRAARPPACWSRPPGPRAPRPTLRRRARAGAPSLRPAGPVRRRAGTAPAERAP